MKNKIKSIICFGLLAFVLAGCSDDDGPKVKPGAINNLTAETLPGKIILRWDLPAADSNIKYVKVNYYDPRTKKNIQRLASAYTDSMIIPETRARYNEYSFTLTPISDTETSGAAQVVKKASEAAAITTTYTDTQIALKAADLSTNAQEPSEGPIANLLDGDTGTFFHTAWSVSFTAPYWLQANLNKTIDNCKIYFHRRTQNNNNRPIDFDLMGSTDGNDWFLIRNFANPADKLPVDAAVNDYTSPVIQSPKPFNRIRINVNKTNNNTVFFTMSEFKVWQVTINVFNPETDETD